MVTFQAPQFLFLLLLIPYGIYFLHLRKNRGSRLIFPFRLWNQGGFSYSQGGIMFLLWLARGFFWLALSFFVVALSGPVRVEKQRLFLNRGLDIMFVLDQSPSMLAQDFKPENRLESAKLLVRNFIETRENDALGLVTFASEAALLVPPTLDYTLVKKRLSAIKVSELGEGTALGMGLAIACLHLERSTAKEKIIVLLTDGVNNSGEISPETAADLALNLGIHIYCLGLGTQGVVPVLFHDPATGQIKRFKFMSGFNEGLLKEISRLTGGRYYEAKDADALDVALLRIAASTGQEKRIKVVARAIPAFRFWLIAGLVFLLLSFFIQKLILKEVF